MNTDGEMLPIPAIEIKSAKLRKSVFETDEDAHIWTAILYRMRKTSLLSINEHARFRKQQQTDMLADDRVMLTHTMCPEAKPAVKDLAVFLKFSQ